MSCKRVEQINFSAIYARDLVRENHPYRKIMGQINFTQLGLDVKGKTNTGLGISGMWHKMPRLESLQK